MSFINSVLIKEKRVICIVFSLGAVTPGFEYNLTLFFPLSAFWRLFPDHSVFFEIGASPLNELLTAQSDA